MSHGEVLTRVTVWVAVVGYATGSCVFALSRRRPAWDRTARLAWTVGCAALLAHVAFAFHSFHGWSHGAAYRDTARQTAEVFGIDWGGGVYVNYALLVAWVLDVAWWWRGLDTYRRRPRLLVAAWQGFLIFIVLNATVVFGTTPVRWLGGAVCLGVLVAWWLGGRRRSSGSSGADYPSPK
jgi:hypothetical protein